MKARSNLSKFKRTVPQSLEHIERLQNLQTKAADIKAKLAQKSTKVDTIRKLPSKYGEKVPAKPKS